jgi:hypothetical protein
MHILSVACYIIIRARNVWNKSLEENKTYFMPNTHFLHKTCGFQDRQNGMNAPELYAVCMLLNLFVLMWGFTNVFNTKILLQTNCFFEMLG